MFHPQKIFKKLTTIFCFRYFYNLARRQWCLGKGSKCKRLANFFHFFITIGQCYQLLCINQRNSTNNNKEKNLLQVRMNFDILHDSRIALLPKETHLKCFFHS